MATRKPNRRTTGIQKHVSPTAARVDRGASQGPRVGRDGKAKIACPGCGSEYMVPEAALDKQLGCKHCGTKFVPANAARTRAPAPFNAKPYYFGAAALVLVVTIYFATRGGEPAQPTTPNTPIVPKVVTGMDNVRVRDARAFGDAIVASDSFTLGSLCDHGAWGAHYGVPAGAGAGEAIAQKLLADEMTHWFREFDLTSAELERREMHDAATGRVVLYLVPKEEYASRKGGKDFWYFKNAQIAVNFRMQDDRAKLGLFEVIDEPERHVRGKAGPKAHKDIGEATVVKRMFNGEEIEAIEAEIVPLGHLDDTPPELRQRIDALIADVISDHPTKPNRAIDALRTIGKPTIPPLLNQMYEIKMDSQESVYRLRRVCQALEQVSGQRFGFTSALITATGASTEELRQSALKQWYGYWTTHHDREDWNIAIESEETLWTGDGATAPDPKKK